MPWLGELFIYNPRQMMNKLPSSGTRHVLKLRFIKFVSRCILFNKYLAKASTINWPRAHIHVSPLHMAVDIGICFLTHMNEHPHIHVHVCTDIYTCTQTHTHTLKYTFKI